LSLAKAGRKLVWTLIFLITGMTLLAIPFWFTIWKPRANEWFMQTGNFSLAFSIIMMAQAFGHLSDGENHWGRTGILTILAAGCAITWLIIILIVGDNGTKVVDSCKSLLGPLSSP